MLTFVFLCGVGQVSRGARLSISTRNRPIRVVRSRPARGTRPPTRGAPTAEDWPIRVLGWRLASWTRLSTGLGPIRVVQPRPTRGTRPRTGRLRPYC